MAAALDAGANSLTSGIPLSVSPAREGSHQPVASDCSRGRHAV